MEGVVEVSLDAFLEQREERRGAEGEVADEAGAVEHVEHEPAELRLGEVPRVEVPPAPEAAGAGGGGVRREEKRE